MANEVDLPYVNRDNKNYLDNDLPHGLVDNRFGICHFKAMDEKFLIEMKNLERAIMENVTWEGTRDE